MRRIWWFLPVWLAMASAAAAQTADPLGPVVVDVHGLMGTLPTTTGWTAPDLPDGTEVPSRGFGVEAGGHVYVARLGPATFGLGGTFGLARGTATAVAADTPDVVGRVTTLAPQVSFNFGHRLGWSYLSAGYGGARFVSESSGGIAPAGTRLESGWVGAVNVGGGARWFLTDHLGVSFDARWHRLSSRDAGTSSLAAARVTLFHLAVGISVK